MELDFSKICRVCMCEGIMMSLFKVNVSKKIMSCSSVQVWQNDGLPGQICNKCSARLHISYQFKKQCEKSDAKLRHYLANMPQREEKVNIDELQELQGQQNIEIIHENQEIDAQTQCVFVGTPQILENLGSVQNKYDHFMTLPQSEQGMTQVNYGPASQNHLQVSNYHVQGVGQLVYNTSYTVPVQPITHTDMHGQVMQSQIQPQVQLVSSIPNQTEEKDALKKSDKSSVKKEKEEGKQCPTCNKAFGTTAKLSRHMKIHSAAQPHQCQICNKRFSHSGNFKIHMRMHTDERPFKCPVCDKGCRQAQDLEKHMRTHTGERPHKCHVCPRAFSTSSNLIAHIRTHTGERPYVCCVCQKAFCQSNELTKHMRTHTGEKSHICDICNRGFNGSSTLIVHRRSHTGERPYICTLCKKGFSQSSCLQVHMKKHNRNFIICVHCKRNFTTASDLKNHLATDHGIENTAIYLEDLEDDTTETVSKGLKCNVCDETFIKVDDYKEHVRSHKEAQES